MIDQQTFVDDGTCSVFIFVDDSRYMDFVLKENNRSTKFCRGGTFTVFIFVDDSTWILSKGK